jgi:hypothetical protein
MGTNSRSISQEELLGILEQDAAVLTKGACVHDSLAPFLVSHAPRGCHYLGYPVVSAW